MDGLTQVVAGGVVQGCLYALMLLGVLVVFRVSKVMSFAYGQVGMVAALTAWALSTSAGLPIGLAIAVGTVIAVLLNGAIDFVAIRRIPTGRVGLDLVVTLGLFLLIAAVMQQLVDSNSHSFPALGADNQATVLGARISINDVVVVAGTLVVVTGSWLVLSRTSLGTNLRACAEDADIAASTGINVRGLRTSTWAIAGLLASAVAVAFASRVAVDAFYMTSVLVKVLIAGMIGGLDRFWPPLLAALSLGVYESLAVVIFGADAGVPAVFLLIIVVLAVVPKRFVIDTSEARA